MSELKVEHLSVKAGDQPILGGVSFALQSGEIHLLIGPNGSGKSSLLQGIMGHPTFQVSEGKIFLNDEDITSESTENKARRGIFLSLQHVPEIAGVTLTNFLFRAQRNMKGSDIAPLDFYTSMQSRAKEFGIDPVFLKKHLNSGLSGGEKKQSELLQLLALEPKFALLDEIDSGVDSDAFKKIFTVILHLKERGVGFLLVSHHPNILAHSTPDVVHVMRGGRIVATGSKQLAEKISASGFESIV